MNSTTRLKRKALRSKGDRLNWSSVDNQKNVSFSHLLDSAVAKTRTDFPQSSILVP